MAWVFGLCCRQSWLGVVLIGYWCLSVTAALAQAAAERLEAQIDAQHYTRGLGFIQPGTPTNDTAEVSAGTVIAIQMVLSALHQKYIATADSNIRWRYNGTNVFEIPPRAFQREKAPAASMILMRDIC